MALAISRANLRPRATYHLFRSLSSRFSTVPSTADDRTPASAVPKPQLERPSLADIMDYLPRRHQKKDYLSRLGELDGNPRRRAVLQPKEKGFLDTFKELGDKPEEEFSSQENRLQSPSDQMTQSSVKRGNPCLLSENPNTLDGDAIQWRSGDYHHLWTKDEEKVLIKLLLGMTEPYYKGSLKADAFFELKRQIKVELPDSKLSDGQIWLKLKDWKATFKMINELRGLSGVEWDDDKKQVIGPIDVIGEKYPFCRLMGIPIQLDYYDELSLIFGEGHATGVGASCINQKAPPVTVEQINDVEHTPLELVEGVDPPKEDNTAEEEDTTVPDVGTTERVQCEQSRPASSDVTSRLKKKRRATSAAEATNDSNIAPMVAEAIGTLREIAASQRELVISQKKMDEKVDFGREMRLRLVGDIQKLDGLTIYQKMKGIQRLVNNHEQMEVFFQLVTDEDRRVFIECLLY